MRNQHFMQRTLQKDKPTLQQFHAYQAAYDYFNESLFCGTLRPCLLNFRGRSKRNLGLFFPSRWSRSDGTATHEIALNPDVLKRALVETMSTLVHEMCHQWQEDFGEPPKGNYHNRQWSQKMESIGLAPSNTGEPGGKKTGRQMTHYVMRDGAFDRAWRAMPKSVLLPWLSGEAPKTAPAPSKNKNKVNYVCKCGNRVWGKSELLIQCGICGEQYEANE